MTVKYAIHSTSNFDRAAMDAIFHYPWQFEQLQSFIKWNPKQFDAPTSSPVKPICIPSPTQSKQMNASSSQHTPVSQSERTWPQRTPNTPISLGVTASDTEADLKQQKEVDALRAELERKRVEVHQLKMR